MQFGVLGPVQVAGAAGVVEVGGARQRRLLSALILHVGDVVSTDRLLDIVFEGAPPSGASTTIRSYVARLRKAIGDAEPRAELLISTEQGGYRLQVEIDTIDAARFEASIETARRQLGERDPIGAAASLRQGLALWRGDAYGDFAVEDWARPEALRLEELKVVAEEELNDALLACGLAHDVVVATRAQIDAHPLREKIRGQQMLALYRVGRQVEALRSLDEFQQVLVDVGLEPSEELLRLGRSIASHDPALRLDSPAGQPLRGYRVGAALGEGAHGVVYRAVQPGVGREVAVKTIRAQLAADPEFIRRFDAEAQLVANLEHPHVVPIYDYWREPGGAYIVMRLLDHNLGARLATGPMDVAEVAAIGRQLGGALAAAHRVGVVHGDIKPSNVLVDASSMYLADFGVATLVESADRDGSAYPSSGYESPELLAGESPSPGSDQFALAVLLVQLLTGHLPFGTRAIATPHDRSPSIHVQRPSVPAPADDVVWRATAWDAADRYPDVETFVDHFEAALAGLAEPRSRNRELTNPYRGLRAFTEVDQAVFFGRDSVIDELVERLARNGDDGRFVVVIGASGSGKSSVVRAGLLPRLRSRAIPGSEHWLITTMTPGSDPFDEFDAALRSVASHDPGPRSDQPDEHEVVRLLDAALTPTQPVLVVIDQLEELFAQVSDESRRRNFVGGLTRAIRRSETNVRIVATLRADFLDRPLRYAEFGQLVKQGAVTIVGMTASELEAAVTRPAAGVGIEVEPALATQLVADVLDQPAALPLLQFTLTELFDRRSGPVLTLRDYDSLGGVDAAVAGRAEAVLGQLADAERDLARRMFLRLVTVDEARSLSRRRALRSDLVYVTDDPDAMAAVIDAFGTARLLTFDRDPESREPTVEIAHEALIAQWPRFVEWVANAGDGLRIQAQLTAVARNWEQNDRDDGDLYRGLRLESALEWAEAQPEAPSPLELEFLTASVDARAAEQDAERRHLEAQQRANRRLRRRLVALAVLLVVAVGVGVIAVTQRNTAREQSARADAAATEARVRELAAASSSVRSENPQLAILLALAALDAGDGTPAPEAQQALHEAVLSSRLVAEFPAGSEGVASSFPSDERFLTLAPGSRTALALRHDAPDEVVEFPHGEFIGDAEVSRDGSRVVTCSFDGTVKVWDSATGRLERELRFEPGVEGLVPAFSNDGTLVVATGSDLRPNTPDGIVAVWDVDSGERMRTFTSPPGTTGPLNVEFSPDDTLVAVTWFGADTADSGAWLWDVSTGDRIHTFRHESEVTDIDFTPDGTRLLTSGADATAKVWDVATGAELATYYGHDAPLRDIEVSPDGTLVATAGSDVQIWWLDTLEPLDVIITHHDVDGLDFGPGSDVLVTSSGVEGTTKLWDLSPQGRYELVGLPGPSVSYSTERLAIDHPAGGVDLAPDGMHLAASRDQRGHVTVWELPTGREATTLDGPGDEIHVIAYAPDGDLLAAGGDDGITIWTTDTHTVLARFAEGELVHDLSFRADGEAVLAADSSGVHEYDLNGNQTVTHSNWPARSAAYRPDGRQVASTTWFVWAPVTFLTDASDGHWISQVRDRPDILIFETAIAYDPTGTRLVAAGLDTAVFDPSAPSERLVDYDGHESRVRDTEVAPTGSEVATAGADGTIRIWDLETGVTRLTISSAGATDLAYAADGRRLAAVGSNGAVTIYLLDLDELIADAQNHLTRGFTDDECREYLHLDTCPPDTPGNAARTHDPARESAVTTGRLPEPTLIDSDATTQSSGDGMTAVAAEFVAALNQSDADPAAALVADDAEIAVFDDTLADRDASLALDLLVRWLAASDWQIELIGCQLEDADTARCSVLQQSAWAAALGIEAVDASIFVDGNDGKITKVTHEFRIFAWGPDHYERFIDHVDQQSTADADQMWNFTDTGPRFAVSDSSIRLFERYTRLLLGSTPTN